MAWYREIFSYQLRHLERPTARFATEFIGDGMPGEHRVDPYRNLCQNIAMVFTAHRIIRRIAESTWFQRVAGGHGSECRALGNSDGPRYSGVFLDSVCILTVVALAAMLKSWYPSSFS